MRLLYVSTVIFAAIVWSSFSMESVVSQNAAFNQTRLKAMSNVISESSGIVRIPLGALRIEIDDEDQPSRLDYLDKRFEAATLAKFVSAYVEKSRHVTMVVTSKTKRDVEGEQQFNAFLEQLGDDKKALILYMPPPTGFDPDAALRQFAATFLKDSNPTKISDPRTKR